MNLPPLTYNAEYHVSDSAAMTAPIALMNPSKNAWDDASLVDSVWSIWKLNFETHLRSYAACIAT